MAPDNPLQRAETVEMKIRFIQLNHKKAGSAPLAYLIPLCEDHFWLIFVKQCPKRYQTRINTDEKFTAIKKPNQVKY